MSAPPSARKNVRSTHRQLEVLLDYMSTHRNFANGEFSGPLGRRSQDLEWVRLQNHLAEFGPNKTVEQWRMTWRDLKKKARTDAARANTARAATGNNVPIPEVSEMSKKILGIIGSESAYGIGLEETGLGQVIEIAQEMPVITSPPLDISPVIIPLSMPSSIPSSIPPSFVPSPDTSPSFILPTSFMPPESPTLPPPPSARTPAISTTHQQSISGRRGRQPGIENKFLKSDAETRSVLKEISLNLENQRRQGEISNRRKHLKRLHGYRKEKNNIMGPKY